MTTADRAPPRAEFSIEARGVHRFFGPVRAVDGFDVALPWGHVIALVGPNGAGKTTLLLMLAGLLAPDRGVVRVAGLDPVYRAYEVHETVGWMPDFFGVYDHLTPREYLDLFGAAHRLTPAQASARSAQLLATVGLAGMSDVPVHTLSRGQKQKLGFARTLVHDPKVLLLDEPASGLDPRARIELRDLVRREAERGVAVVISSHILAELEEMADMVVFMDKGRCTGVHRLTELPRAAGTRPWRIRALDPEALVDALAAQGHDGEPIRGGGMTVALSSEEDAARLLASLVEAGVRDRKSVV